MTTATHNPAWATDSDSCDVGSPDEYTVFSTEFGRQPALDVSTFARTAEVRVLGWQYTNDQNDLPADEPSIEVWRDGAGVLLLTLSDARQLAALLLSSADRMAATS